MKNNNGFIYIPKWTEYLMIAALIIGLIAIPVGIIAAIVWLVNHVRFI
jgi:hypothetical protein